MTTMRSARRAASRTLCVTNSTVRPRRPDELLELGVQGVAGHRVEGAERLVHQQDVGVLGERTRQCGALAHAAGQLVRPLRRRSRRGALPTAAARREPAARACGTPARRIGSSMLAATVSHGNSADSWNISAGRPATSTLPDVGVSSPATRLRIVDLPQPDAPTRQTNSPAPTSMSTSRARRRRCAACRTSCARGAGRSPCERRSLARSQRRRPRLVALGEHLVEQRQVVDARLGQVDRVEQADRDGVVGGSLQRRGDRVEREREASQARRSWRRLGGSW